MLTILKQLAATPGRKDKEAILRLNSSATLKNVFRLTLDPTINFYVKTFPKKQGIVSVTLDSALNSLDVISSRYITGDAARDHLSKLSASLTEDDAEVLRRVIARNLECGVSEGTVNAVWKELITSYPCMLVSPMSTIKTFKFPAYAQVKCDGLRVNAHCGEGPPRFYTRNGKEMNLLGALDSSFPNERVVIDGELLVEGCDRKTGNGILLKFQKGTGTAAEAAKIQMVAWDCIPTDDFKKRKCTIPYSERWAKVPTCSNKMRAVITQAVTSIENAELLYEVMLARGEEGLVLKDPKGIWEDKRVKHQVKMKAELDADLLCVGTTEGVGKYNGLIGSLILESRGGKVKVSAGTGMSDWDRKLDPSEYIGQIIGIRYNSIIKDKNGGTSLFLPVFENIRPDKTVPDEI